MAVSDGMTVGWTSPMIPYFLSENSHLKISRREAELLETWLLIGSIAGIPPTIYFVNKIGRKKSLLLASAALFFAWIVIIFANRIEYIYGARFIAGMGGDMAFVAAPMYIAEIADQNIRGFLSSIIYLMMLTGIMLIYAVGWYCPFYVAPLISIILLVVELIIFSFLPETPYYLYLQHRHDEAKSSLSKFRSGKNFEKELVEISEAVRKKEEESEKLKITDIFLIKNYRKAMMIMTVLNAAQQLSSINVILMNMHEILSAAGSIYMETSTTAIIFAALMFLAAAAASVTIDKFGRKNLLISSSVLTGLCLLALAIYFHVKHSGMEYQSMSWIPLVSVMIYALVYKFGLGMVPIVITAEIFAPKFKALGMALADGVYVGTAMVSIALYNFLRTSFGMHFPFYIFSCCAFLTAIFIICFIPETKGKSLEDIQRILRGEIKSVERSSP